MFQNILPSLNYCGYCEKLNCKWCFKCSLNCSSCIRDRCQNCYQFNKTKDILINCGNEQISNYVRNFLIDYFNASDITNYFLKMNITMEVKEKNPINIVNFENKKQPIAEKEKTNKNFFIVNKKNTDIIVNCFNLFVRKNSKKKYFVLGMGSIDIVFFLNMSPARLMIRIWEFSYHVHHFLPENSTDCKCNEYLNLCIDAV